MSITANQAQLLDQMGVGLLALNTKFSKAKLTELLAAHQQLCISFTAPSEGVTRLGRPPADAEFDLTFRSTGHWRTIIGWQALADFLGMQKGSAQVRFSTHKGKLNRVCANPSAGDTDDLLVITHTNRRATLHGQK